MDNLEEYERRLAELEARMAQVSELMAGWPTPATLLQGFLAGRFQRRDGHGYQQPLENIPEAPADGYYYGRHNYQWEQVVEEAPGLTSRRSVTGWARASFGSDTPWISLDDVLVNYVPEVPIGQAAYARSRAGDGSAGWANINALGYLSTSGGQMTGPLITRDGGSATNPGLAIGENSTGFYRTGGANSLLVTTVSGVIVMQMQASLVAYFISVNFTGKPLNAVGDPVLPDDALNLRTGDARYMQAGASEFLPISGGTMTGSLISAPGTGTNNLGIGVGDNTTGFYRSGGSLFAMALGFPLLALDGNARSLLMVGPLGMGGNPVTNLGNPILPSDATSKSYVDAAIANARSPTVIYDIPADVAISGDGSWQLLAQVPFILTRTGLSRIQITLNCNTTGVNNVAAIGARLAEGGTERSVFGFGVTPGGDSVGFTCNLYHDSAAGQIYIPIELNSLPLTGTPTPFTVLGGNGPRRSQIVITDLGLAP
jgi:hypothetical protein